MSAHSWIGELGHQGYRRHTCPGETRGLLFLALFFWKEILCLNHPTLYQRFQMPDPFPLLIIESHHAKGYHMPRPH